MSDEDEKIVALRPDRPQVDERTGVPIEIQEKLDGELLDLVERIREMIEGGEINAISMIAYNDEGMHEVTINTARIWSSPSRTMGLLDMNKIDIARKVHAAVDAAEYDED